MNNEEIKKELENIWKTLVEHYQEHKKELNDNLVEIFEQIEYIYKKVRG